MPRCSYARCPPQCSSRVRRHEAVVLANVTHVPQTATSQWKGKELRLELKPDEVLIEE